VVIVPTVSANITAPCGLSGSSLGHWGVGQGGLQQEAFGSDLDTASVGATFDARSDFCTRAEARSDFCTMADARSDFCTMSGRHAPDGQIDFCTMQREVDDLVAPSSEYAESLSPPLVNEGSLAQEYGSLAQVGEGNAQFWTCPRPRTVGSFGHAPALGQGREGNLAGNLSATESAEWFSSGSSLASSESAESSSSASEGGGMSKTDHEAVFRILTQGVIRLRHLAARGKGTIRGEGGG